MVSSIQSLLTPAPDVKTLPASNEKKPLMALPMPQELAGYLDSVRGMRDKIMKLRAGSKDMDLREQTKELQKQVMGLQNWLARHLQELKTPEKIGMDDVSLAEMRSLLNSSVRLIIAEQRRPVPPEIKVTATAGDKVVADEIIPQGPEMPKELANFIDNIRKMREEIEKKREQSPDADLQESVLALQKQVMGLQNWLATHLRELQTPEKIGLGGDKLRDMRSLLSASVQLITREFSRSAPHVIQPVEKAPVLNVKAYETTVAKTAEQDLTKTMLDVIG